MKKNLQPVIALSMLIVAMTLTQFAAAQVTFNESFDNVAFLPSGWSAVGPITYWSQRATGFFPTCTPHTGAGMARFRSNTAPPTTSQTIATPVIDYSGVGTNTPTFSLWLYRDTTFSTIADSIRILINTTLSLTGATSLGVIARSAKINLPDTVSASGWYQYSFNIPNTFNTVTNYILLDGVAIGGGDNIFIDDVQWVAYPLPCSGVPNAGNVVAGQMTICNGGGATTLSLDSTIIHPLGVTYQWQFGPTTSGPWTNFATGPSVSTGILTGTTSFRCVVSCSYSGLADSTAGITITIKSNPNPTVTVTPANAAVCSGSASPVLLSASGAATYTWSPATGLNLTTGDTVRALPTVNTTYTVTGTDTVGCVGTGTSVLTVRTPPNPTLTITRDTICAGDSTVITAIGGGFGLTYLWMPGGGTTNRITARPTTTTTYSLTATNNFGCSVTDTMRVTVNPAPVTTASSTPTAICGGGHTQLSASGGITYSWRPAAGLDSTTIANPVATPSGTTNYSVTITGANGCRITDSVRVTVNPPPVLVITPSFTVCPGSSIQLSVSGTVTYQWSPPTALSSTTGANPFATPLVTTTYTVIGSDSIGCSSTATTKIVVSPTVTLSATINPICEGDSTIITALSPDSGVTYLWSTGNTTSSISVHLGFTATYSLVVTSPNSCTNTANMTVVVETTAHPSFTYSVNGLTVTFNNTTAGGPSSWYWLFGDGNTSTLQNPVHTYANFGNYVVNLIAINACGTYSITDSISFQPAGITEFDNSGSLTIYSNPFNTSTQISFSLIKSERVTLKVYDLIGKEIVTLADKTYSQGTHLVTLNRNQLSAGAYLLRFVCDDAMETKKVIVE